MLKLLLVGLPVLGLLAAVSRAFYNLYLHPLRKWPGSFWGRASFLTWIYVQWTGESSNYVIALHEKYGDVVRVAPDLLSYINAQAWPDIYGHKTGVMVGENKEPGNGNLPKSKDATRGNLNNHYDIVNVPHEADHRRMKRLQSHMFSAAALTGQQPLIRKYIDLLMSRLREKAEIGDPIDLVMWLNYATFDMLGALAFGEDFQCLKTGEFHPWVTNIFGSLKQSFFTRLTERFSWPLNTIIYHVLVPRFLTKARHAEFDFATRKARERMAQGHTDSHDFMSYILKYNDEKGMTPGEIESNSSVLIIAGSETTAIYLSGLTYHLLNTDSVRHTLTKIVREKFNSEEEITPTEVNNMEYLTAVLAEGGRTYPPVPSGLPRFTQKGGNTICGEVVPEGTIVFVHQYAAYSSPRNFTDPMAFVPERWLKDPPARYANDNLKVVQPFSVGPKACIGRNLAYAEMRLILCRLLWNFDLELCESSRNWKEKQKVFNVWQKMPLHVKLKPRIF